MPLVSIILPTYKDAKYILRSIRSVFEQSFSDWELIIVDDGLEAKARERVLAFLGDNPKVCVVTNFVNLGLQSSLNRGVSVAKGRLIARIDDDDVWLDKSKLEKQTKFMEANPACVLVGTGAVVLNAEGEEFFRYIFPSTDSDIRKKILTRDCFIHSSVLFRKNEMLRCGGYSEEKSVKHIEDYDLWLKIGLTGKICNLPIHATGITVHSQSISYVNKALAFERMISLIRKFKYEYPNYHVALLWSYFRFYFYVFLIKIPIEDMHQKVLKIYRKITGI